MTISYNWLSEYLPVTVEPERLSKILTSLGLEVESMEPYEEFKGGLEGLLIGEVLTAEQHPNADKLKITTVNIGSGEPLSIVCGASNVAAGQKVIVAPVGSTIYPASGEPLTMRVAKIRGVESHGMICADDEIGTGTSHDGILVLPSSSNPGMPASSYFQPYNDWIYEIGLTPNRMDAMSHLGVAKDVCAYLTHHDKKAVKPKLPFGKEFTAGVKPGIDVKIENNSACQRYSGLSLSGVKVGESPKWLIKKLKSIGQRPINNIVDITNFILHETGQPLHAFDAAAITGKKIIVKNLPEGTPFITLDGKERKLSAEDLMICNEEKGMCIAGIFGGAESGVKQTTTDIFLESAWFNPVDIRKTSFRHGLRTDAATRFEKNVDISNTVNVLKRAAQMIIDIAGGQVSSAITDVYPDPAEKKQIHLKYQYLKKLSGKNYQHDTVNNILTSLGFEIVQEGPEDLLVAAPYSKPDISLPADIVEEIMRVDGYDNIEIPQSIMISPSVDTEGYKQVYAEKTANYLVGLGFYEIFTNSITNKAFYNDAELSHAVKMLNSLSAELNIMRPSMLETGLQSVSHNINRKNSNLLFFEFGKTYSVSANGQYGELPHLSLYMTGQTSGDSWKAKGNLANLFYVKGLVKKITELLGIALPVMQNAEHDKLDNSLQAMIGDEQLLILGSVRQQTLAAFDIRQEVWFLDFNWKLLLELARKAKLSVKELARQMPVHRDLALVLEKSTAFDQVEKTIHELKLEKLRSMELFDVFESDKLGAGKKSLAVSFTFLDEEKTLTDKEIDSMMNKIMTSVQKELSAEIRKA
ncbi:MAG: phenylalanine--tRNA ligase subunit beta [Gemmatimonadaceae bacterium]|nr:phenylalanine--tRNA ligase subunit beta [Chitinophagaceae bacterium]